MPSVRRLSLALLLAAAAAAPGRADEPGPLRAAPLDGRLRVDGHLDEPAWQSAPVYRGFVRIGPTVGGAPDQATEVRVLQGPSVLYVGIRCLDGEPGRIVHPRGRRDHPPRSDQVTVYVGRGGDARSAAAFQLTAGGVESDGLVYDDDQISWDWDAVWEGAAAVDGAGWSAELAIPASAVPSEGEALRFGVVREVARSRERSASFPLPRDARALASRLGALEGVTRLAPGAAVEVAPYLAARLTARPRSSDPARPRPRITDPTLDAGLDLRARAGGLSLAGTLNPDFGQVEADRIVQNLTTFETFFPEKRPFFSERFEVFQPVGAGDEPVPQQLFYSRRIGVRAPILAAIKVAGDVGRDLRVGLVEVLGAGTGQPAGASEEAPRRGLRWTPAQPLRLAPEDAYPAVAPVPESRLAAVVRWQAAPGVTLGAQGTSVRALAASCAAADAASASPPAACRAPGAEAAAADFQAVTPGGDWYAHGQGATSRASAGPPTRTLRDGTVLRRGDLGAGTYLRAGKRGGEPLRFDLGWTWASPRLDLNAAGFQPTSNEQEGKVRVAWTRPRVSGPFDEWEVSATASARRTTDGRDLDGGARASAGVYGELSGSHLTVECNGGATTARWDVRELAGTGVPLRMPGSATGDCTVATDASRALSGSVKLYAERAGPLPGLDQPWSGGTVLTVAGRAHDRLETRLSLVLDASVLPLRFVGEDGAGRLLLARQEAPSASILVTQLWAIARGLTLQLHGQLFTAYERYDRFLTAAPRGTAPVGPGDLAPAPAPAERPDGRTTLLVLDAVLRWEVRPGATLFVVYARNQAGLPADGTQAARTLSPAAAGRGPVTDALLVKWSWWTGV